MAGVNSRGLEAGWIRITNLEEALAILIFMNGGLKRIAPGLIPNKFKWLRDQSPTIVVRFGVGHLAQSTAPVGAMDRSCSFDCLR